MELTEEKIKNISEKLKTIPKKNKFSKREAVGLLKNDITSLQSFEFFTKTVEFSPFFIFQNQRHCVCRQPV